MSQPRPTEEAQLAEVAKRATAGARRTNELNAEPQSHQHDVEPMSLERIQALNEDDLSAAVELAVHLGRATRAVQLTVGAALTYRRHRMQGRQWNAYLQERCIEWGRNERTLQRWMEASQKHYGIEAPKGAQAQQRGRVRTPVIPRGGAKPAGSAQGTAGRRETTGEHGPNGGPDAAGTPWRGTQGAEWTPADQSRLSSRATPIPTDRPLRALPPAEITPNAAATRLIGAEPGEMGLQTWRSVRHAAEEAITALLGAVTPHDPRPTGLVASLSGCAHPKAERVVRNGGIVACGACGAIRRPSGQWV